MRSSGCFGSIDAESPDELWCLGDLVGYGPRPNRCCALVAERADVCLIGNHDLGVLGRIDLEGLLTGCCGGPHAGRPRCWRTSRARYLESLSPSVVLEQRGALPREPP